jgi:acyl carrier protein
MSFTSAESRGKITALEIQDILINNAGAPSNAFEDGDASLEEIGLDSLAVLELQAVAKDRFDIQIPEEALAMSVTEIVALANENAGGE